MLSVVDEQLPNEGVDWITGTTCVAWNDLIVGWGDWKGLGIAGGAVRWATSRRNGARPGALPENTRCHSPEPNSSQAISVSVTPRPRIAPTMS